MQTLDPLFVMVTRTGDAGVALCQRIEEAGGKAFYFPAIDFAPPQNPEVFEEGIEKLGEADWWIFISPQAVKASLPAIQLRWPNHLPSQVKVAAVGGTTAVTLQKYVHVEVIYPPLNWSSEGLLQLPVFQSVLGKKIVLIKGEGGRELIDKTLTARGAFVSHLMAYRRILPTVDIETCFSLLNQSKINVIIGSSCEGLHYLKDLLGFDAWVLIKSIPLIVMSERIKRLACHLGFQTIWVTQNKTEASTMAILSQIRKK